MKHLVSVGLAAVAVLLPASSAQQLPGEFPRLFADDNAGNQAPTSTGPFDNTAVFTTTAGKSFDGRLTYLAEGGAGLNDSVPWGLLVSVAKTPFPAAEPPPLFTMPPFALVLPTPLLLDASGEGSIPLSVPAGLNDATFFLQAIVQDASSATNLALSNGVTVNVEPPGFNVRFGYLLEQPGQGTDEFVGAGSLDLGPELMGDLPPFGTADPPGPVLDDLGLDGSPLSFLQFIPNTPDAPINPLSFPVTTLTEDMTPSLDIDEFNVEDTSFFPEQGTIYVERKGDNLFKSRTSILSMPKLEAVTYTGKTPTSFTGCTRQVLGSSNSSNFPHDVGDMVLGEFTVATTSGALSRSRVGVDMRNVQMPHVVIPAFSFDGGEGVGEVTMDLDLYLYERADNDAQGFLVHDRESGAWRVIEGSEIDTSGGESWNRMVHVAPDGRSILAALRVQTGAEFASDPDELWAFRLDGLDWPASGAQGWNIAFETGADPDPGASEAVSREIYMPSVRIAGSTPDNYVAFVGLKSKWAQSDGHNNNDSESGYEGFYAREEVIVNSYVDVPLVPPGSAKAVPSEPRPDITGNFPAVGNGAAVVRFDPVPLVAPHGGTVFVVAGAKENNEDMYSLVNIGITSTGESTYSIINCSGFGFSAGVEDDPHELRLFNQGGFGNGQRGAVSPDGKRVAFTSPESDGRDWLHVARASGSDFALVRDIYKEIGGTKFEPAGSYKNDRAVRNIHWVDNDRVLFTMGALADSDPTGSQQGDVFQYTVSSDLMEIVINTSPSLNEFADLGVMQFGGSFVSPDRRYYFLIRTGERCTANCDTTPVMTPVLNVLAVDTQTGASFDITGGELGGSVLPDLYLSDVEFFAPLETPVALQFMEGGGVQDGLMYFVSHLESDADETDEIFALDMDSPGVVFAVTSDSPDGSHVSNVTPNPHSSSVAFARTEGTDPLAGDQHPFMVDLDNFLFLRDLTPTAVLNGNDFGRVMDGSFHFVEPDPANGAGDALVFSFGLIAEADTGIAQVAAPVYYSLASLSDTLLEPQAVLLPIMNTQGLGGFYAVSLTSVRLSQE